MAVPPAPAGAGLSDPTHDRTSSHRLRLALTGLLVLLLVASAGVLVSVLVAKGSEDRQAAREQVRSVANQFLLRMGTYGPDMLDESGKLTEYRERVTDVITPKFGTDFANEVDTLEQLVLQGGVARDTEIFATGVSALDEDSARVLVAGTFTNTYTQGQGKKARTVPQEPFPFRIQVELVRVDGEWLVDDFSGVSDGDEAAPGTGVVPEPPAPEQPGGGAGDGGKKSGGQSGGGQSGGGQSGGGRSGEGGGR